MHVYRIGLLGTILLAVTALGATPARSDAPTTAAPATKVAKAPVFPEMKFAVTKTTLDAKIADPVTRDQWCKDVSARVREIESQARNSRRVDLGDVIETFVAGAEVGYVVAFCEGQTVYKVAGYRDARHTTYNRTISEFYFDHGKLIFCLDTTTDEMYYFPPGITIGGCGGCSLSSTDREYYHDGRLVRVKDETKMCVGVHPPLPTLHDIQKDNKGDIENIRQALKKKGLHL